MGRLKLMHDENKITRVRLHRRNCNPITPSHLLLEHNLQGNLFSTGTVNENVELNIMKCKKRYNH